MTDTRTSAVTVELEMASAALIALAERGIPTDVQELLVYGNPDRGIAPGALSKAVRAVLLHGRHAQRQPHPTVTDEMLNAHIKALGNWAEPFTAERESGVAIDSDISQEDADFFNEEERKRLRIGYAAAFTSTNAATLPAPGPSGDVGRQP